MQVTSTNQSINLIFNHQLRKTIDENALLNIGTVRRVQMLIISFLSRLPQFAIINVYEAENKFCSNRNYRPCFNSINKIEHCMYIIGE